MAAGGFREFIAGETLDEDAINDYLMQGMLVFAGTAARGSAIGTPVEGQFSFLADSDSVEFYDGSQWTALETSTVATGGDSVGTANGYKYHVFLSSGTFTLSSSEAAVEYLIIGGGGAGGDRQNDALIACGGGGAGGVLTGVANLSAGAYTVTVGDGGAATANTVVSGNASSFGAIGTAFAGGGGGNAGGTNNAVSGASGGGGGASSTQGANGAAPLGPLGDIGEVQGIGEQGHAGGGGAVSLAGGGGGYAGAGHTGEQDGNWESRTTSEFFGDRTLGGIGGRFDDWGADTTTIAGTAIGDAHTYTPNAGGTATAYFFGGGGNGGNDVNSTVRQKGPGGGGNGASTTVAAENGVDYTGGGGGGGANGSAGGDGGAGLVVVRYPV